MKKQKKTGIRIAAAVCVAVLILTSAAFAADIGGIRRTVQLWIHGASTEAVIDFDGNGSYTATYTDEDGTQREQGGGGVAIENGTERPLTEDELLETMDMPVVEYKEDGSVWVYWRDQSEDITARFEDGICRVLLQSGEETQYITAKYKGGYATDPNGYPGTENLD